MTSVQFQKWAFEPIARMQSLMFPMFSKPIPKESDPILRKIPVPTNGFPGAVAEIP
jgi:hypothetical protein